MNISGTTNCTLNGANLLLLKYSQIVAELYSSQLILTHILYIIIFFNFINACLSYINDCVCVIFLGLGMGVKIFITKYIYNKYPRLKKKYDSTHKLWLTLPTDVQYKKQCHREEVHKVSILVSMVY